MKRLVVLMIAMGSCGYPALPEVGGDAGVQGNDSGDSDGSGISVAPPTGLMYSQTSPTYLVGSAITPDVPSSSGGPIASYSISPDLPDGLSLDSSTGIITGTPTAVSAASAYIVTGTNTGGSATVDLVITVDITAPTELAYSPNPVIYTVGIPILPNIPSTSGGPIASYSISPELPAGLSFDTSTGEISGTPTEETWTQNYMITASNAGGSAVVSVPIGVAMAGFVAVGGSHSCAIKTGGLWCWGANTSGQLGDNELGSNSALPVQVVGLGSGVQAVAAGLNHTCAIVNGALDCWGYGGDGELGNNSGSNSAVPVPVMGLGSGVQAVTAGQQHTCALVNGGVWCWGNDYAGQLGDGSASLSQIPVPVTGLGSGVQAIAAGDAYTCAVINDGSVWCWGNDNDGQLGDENTMFELVPVEVSGLTSGAETIAAGFSHTCAIVNGGVECWGDNQDGELGSGVLSPSLVPVQVSGLTSDVQAIAASGAHSCAAVNGAVKCWGENTNGELGTGAAGSNSSAPLQVSGLTGGVTAVATGSMADQTCVHVNNSFECWGENNSGQLGTGSASSYIATPNFVSGL